MVYILAKPDNYAMYSRFFACLTIPLESAICEINMKPITIKKLIPKRCKLFSMCNAVSRYKRHPYSSTIYIGSCFMIPCSNIINTIG